MATPDYDPVAELADRMLEKYRRGEEPGFEDKLAWDGLTDEERERFMSDAHQRIEHGNETLEALREDIRLLKVLLTPCNRRPKSCRRATGVSF